MTFRILNLPVRILHQRSSQRQAVVTVMVRHKGQEGIVSQTTLFGVEETILRFVGFLSFILVI